MTGKPRKRQVFHRIKLMSLGTNWMSIENHRIICGKRGTNPSQPINSPFTAYEFLIMNCVYISFVIFTLISTFVSMIMNWKCKGPRMDQYESQEVLFEVHRTQKNEWLNSEEVQRTMNRPLQLHVEFMDLCISSDVLPQ